MAKNTSRLKAGPSRLGGSSGGATAVRSSSSGGAYTTYADADTPEQQDDDAGEEQQAQGNDRVLKRKEFVDLIVTRSGMKKKDVRAAVDATLAVMGDALRDGKTLALSANAKIKPVKQNPFSNGTVVTTKFRMKDEAPQEAPAALAEPEQQG